MNWLVFTVCAFAVYRLSHMLAGEEGPAAVFARMRRKVPAKTNPGRGIRCNLCWSVWIAALATGYMVWLGSVTPLFSPVYAFGLSGVAMLLHKLDGSD